MDIETIFRGPLTPTKWRALKGYLESQRIFPGHGVRLSKSSAGITLSAGRSFPSGHGGAPRKPWDPVFFFEGTPESPVHRCRFNLGTVNNVPPTNWNDAHTLAMGDGEFHFVVVTVTTGSGAVSGLTLSVDEEPPETDTVARDVPPTTHKIILGAVGKSTARMIETTNLNLFGQLVFVESKPAPAVGAEPYSRWWRWAHTSV